MVAARIANLEHGHRADLEDRSNERSSITEHQAGEMMNVGRASVGRAKRVFREGAKAMVAARIANLEQGGDRGKSTHRRQTLK